MTDAGSSFLEDRPKIPTGFVKAYLVYDVGQKCSRDRFQAAISQCAAFRIAIYSPNLIGHHFHMLANETNRAAAKADAAVHMLHGRTQMLIHTFPDRQKSWECFIRKHAKRGAEINLLDAAGYHFGEVGVQGARQ